MQEFPDTYRTVKERVLWFATVVVIVLLSVFGREVQLILITWIDSRIIAGAVFLILAGLLFTLWKKRDKYHIKKPVFLVATTLLLIGIVAVQLRYLLPAEALHFLVFSWLGWISITVFGPLYGILTVVLVAVGDEFLQYYLPGRFGDLHDIVINLLSGFIGIILRIRC